MMNKFNQFSNYYLQMLHASNEFIPELEYIYYNAYNNFTLQYALMLAPLRTEDDRETVLRKMQLVSGFVDIFIALRILNFRTLSYSSIQYTVFNLIREIRDLDIYDLSRVLREIVSGFENTFAGVIDFYMHSQNKWRIQYLLARMTYTIEKHSGIETDFIKYISHEIKKPFEIEHIWADKFERHMDEFDAERDFQDYRNRFGGLILLPQGFNQSLGDDAYEVKVEHYLKSNLMAQSLHPRFYEKNPSFVRFIRENQLLFQPHYPSFKKADLDNRQELYQQICEFIWNPDRFEKILQ